MTVEKIVQEVRSAKGKSGGWPASYDYDSTESKSIISLNGKKADKKAYRGLDAWGMAFVAYVEEKVQSKIGYVAFEINDESKITPNIEALRRRISFLHINTEKIFSLKLNGENIPLYDTEKSLFSRPNDEIIRSSNLKQRGDTHAKWLLEKDFQAFLFGNGFEKDERVRDLGRRPNGRLAILGEDFRGVNKKKYGVIREFPTGVFRSKVSEETRILPTEYVDIISLDKHGRLAVIELKIDDSSLEIISQALDYALFFACYSKQLMPFIKTNCNLSDNETLKDDFSIYMASNIYHPKMSNILPFYSTKNKKYLFTFKQVFLGFSEEI